jgi:hypothetical protein
MPIRKGELCRCLGADPDCSECGGTGTIEPPTELVRGSPWTANIHVPEGRHYVECYPTSHVRCRYCGRRIARRKIDAHVRSAHPDV